MAPEGITRVFFTVVGSKLVLLHGIVKKSGKTPEGDLATARRRRNEVIACVPMLR